MEDKKNSLNIIINGIINENPTFVLMLGMCPTLAVTTSVKNAVGMGLATTFVLICSNSMISAFRNIISDNIRIPAYIVVIASFVTIVKILLEAFFYDLYNALGIYIPLIVVNCIILGRAESFANKHNIYESFFDGLGIGLGFTISLTLISAFRELFGSGALLGFRIFDEKYAMNILILAPGAFFVLAFINAIINYIKISKKIKDKNTSCCNNCANCISKEV